MICVMFHAKCLSQALDNLNTTYENTIVRRNFNVEPNEATMTKF